MPRIRRCCGASSAATRRASRRETHPRLDRLVGHAVRYFDDFVRPAKTYRLPDEVEAAALQQLADALGALAGGERR